LAEDNEINQMVASEILFKAGYRCDIVATGRAALEAIIDDEYDLVLMDCQMPDLDGFEATRAIREHEREVAPQGVVPRIPIIALTANAAKGDRGHCLSAGMDAYVTKPIDPSQLIGTIDTLLATASNPEQVETASSETAEAAAPTGSSAFHLDSLLHRCLGDAAFCSVILQKFADRSADQLAAISRAIESNNTTELALHAHTLKGVAANLSVDEVRSCAAELERIGRTGELALAPQIFEQLKAEIHRCLRELPQIMAQLAERK
jgi:CheY-like chemotaxis protein